MSACQPGHPEPGGRELPLIADRIGLRCSNAFIGYRVANSIAFGASAVVGMAQAQPEIGGGVQANAITQAEFGVVFSFVGVWIAGCGIGLTAGVP